MRMSSGWRDWAIVIATTVATAGLFTFAFLGNATSAVSGLWMKLNDVMRVLAKWVISQPWYFDLVLFASIFIPLSVLGFAFLRRNFTILWHRENKRVEPITGIGELFTKQLSFEIVFSNLLFAISGIFLFWRNEVFSLLPLAALASAANAYHFLTKLRSSCGWLGDNKVEAADLMLFVVERAAGGTLPPGTRPLSAPKETGEKAATRSATQDAVGAQA